MFRLFLPLCLIVLPLQAFAKSETPANPVAKLEEVNKKMLEGLDENQVRQFAAIRNSHGIIRSVEDIERTLEAASKSCSDHNPEFAQSMQTRVGQWKDNIDPILKDARHRLNEMIKLQNYAKPSEAKAYLKKVDEAVAFKSKSMKTIPITEKKECRKLLGTLDDTQEDLTKLLVENLGLNKPVAQGSGQ